ncbi:MAG: Coenzyme F420 hydrogenase/dehydrogenase, beta subunit C-terminal domain [Methanomassiliicoccales archaeon]|nr:MAG: Coenzyme F420 hydrogenase/dehydrogenase, beta subunit C-terminal domain [Methanomassiliicoccales archaeon]
MTKGENNLQMNICDLLGQMLNKECVDAVLVPKKLPFGEGVVQTLITDENKLKEAKPLAFVMPVSTGTIISEMTKVEPSEKKIAAVMKPCEIRAAVELLKLKQAAFDNIIIIGVDCPGTYSVNDYKEIISEGKSPMDIYLSNVKEGKDDEKMRAACKVCEYSIPENVDITIGILGSDLKTPLIMYNSEKGKDIIKILGIKPQEDMKKREEEISKLKKRRLAAWDTLLQSTQKDVGGLDNLLAFFESCIKCHNCMDVCPVCYCRECFFESPTFEYEAQKYLSWSQKKGILKMPKDTLLFHLTRMNHMATSCVGCGMCEQACPSKIELLRIYKTVGHNAQKVFDYVPGRSVDEELPLLTFREEELEPR